MLPLFRLSSTQSLKTYARLKYLFLAIAILFFCRSIVGEIFHQKVTSCNSQLEQTLPTEDQCIKSNLLFTGIIDSLKSHLPTEHVLPDFTINEYSSIIHKNSDRGLFFKIIKKNYNSSRLWYYIFFILDFILSIGIVTFFILINAQSYADSDDLKKHKFSQRSLNLIAILGISAFVLDTFEGLHYLYFTEGLLSFITCGKLISYTLFGTSGVLLFVYFKFKTGYFKILGIFVISSFFSLLLIFSLFILVTMVGQGGTIIIDLFSSQLNFLLLFFLINFAAFVLSHFPQYLSEKIDPKKGRTVIWKRYTKSNIFGIIYFNYLNSGSESGRNKLDNFMRRSLGTVLFLVWIYVLLFTVNNYILNYHSNLILSFVLGISSAILLLHLSLINTSQDLSSEYSKCSCGIDCPGKNKDNHQCTLPADRKEVRQNLSNKMKKAIVWLITLTVISTIGTIILCCNITQWGVPGSMIAIIITILNSVAFIIFRECRSHLMYFLGINEKWAKKDPEDTEPLDFENSKKSQNSYERSIIEKDKSQEIPQIWNYNLLRNIGNLSNHIYYLKIMKLAFFIISGTILIIGIFRTTWLNPAIYIIYFFSAITYLLSITAKQFYFYYQKVKDNEDAYNEFKKIDKEHLQRFKFYAPFAFLLPIAIGSFAIIQGNDLHKFKNVKEEQTTLLTLDEFKEDIRQSSIQNCLKNKPIFSLSSFGGGLKANYWTLNVLNELELKSDNAFIKNTLSMSGVSGGAMGLSLHPFIYSKSASNRIRDIDKIGDANILSIDAFYMLFADLIKELIPEFIYKFEGKDRSHKAMSKYNELLCESVEDACKNDFDSLSFRQQWSNFYNDNTYYPALIMNTTSTNRRYGYACSIRGVDFEGGINIVDYKENSKISISYFNASSTVNRFAFMSPAASVPQKGHFVDGGYFENSGLLSTLSFWDKFNGKDSSESSGVSNNLTGPSEYQFHYSNEDSTEVERRPWHVVCLINGKGYWIKNLLEKYSLSHLSLSKSKGSAEIGAIVKTIIGTEMLPTYYIEKMQHELRDRFHPIYMPFMINYQDVENLLGGTPSPIYFDRIKTMIQENNEKIEKALRSTGEEKYNRLAWGIVEPTLARLLSLPDREYQKAMINHHPDLIKDINDVAKLCN